MLGISADGKSKAYPMKSILAADLIEDHFGESPVLIVVGPDGASIRVFRAQLPAETTPLLFIRSSTPSDEAIMTDAESGSAWSVRGCAVSGRYANRCLIEVNAQKDYWFDWLKHNPSAVAFKY